MTYATRYDHEKYKKWYHRKPWPGLRIMCLKRDPLCVQCIKEGRTPPRPSTRVDHIKPHRGVWSLFCDLDNLQGLCEPCHNTKTAKEDGGFGNDIPDPAAPVVTGTSGRQFQSTSQGDDKLDKALGDIDELLEGV